MTIAQMVDAMTPADQAGNVQNVRPEVADRYFAGQRDRKQKWLERMMRGR